jgi:ATP-dependent Clp protease ATP-binding subunit ClpA
MFERFTDRARRAVVTAQEEARMLGHNHVGSEHLLLGLLHEQGGIAAQALEPAGVTVEAARAQVAELAGPGDKSPAGHIPFTQRAKKILELSLREALEQQKSYIGTEHILLALLRDPDNLGAQVIERLGGSLPALRQRVLEEARALGPDPAGQEEAEHWMWARDWQNAQAFTRGGRVPPQTVSGYRGLLAPIDQRLASIERHLGISAAEEPPLEFRGLLQSLDRRLARIERHLGISADEADEGPEEAVEEAGEDGPAASAE